MAKITRKTAKIFGETASTTGTDPEIGQFGSAKAGTYVGTGDIDTIQGLSAWSNGWIDAVTPTQQFPTLPEMTGVHKVLSYQTAYLLQEGIPEYDANTTYYINSLCKGLKADGNLIIYQSLTNDNTGNALSDTANWQQLYGFAADQDLSNLSNTGNNRLHALKGYKDEGELLTDSEGFIDVRNYTHSTYIDSKYTIIGSPAIIDGVAELNQNNNLVADYVLNPLTNDFKVKIAIIVNADILAETTTNQVLLANNSSDGFLYCPIGIQPNKVVSGQTAFRFWTTDGNTNGDITLSINNPSNCVLGDVIYYTAGRTGTTYYASIQKNNETIVNASTTSSNTSVANTDKMLIGAFGSNYVSLTAYHFVGKVDLKTLIIEVDGDTVFTANITGTDTYTIGGNTVSIPYTLSKTGSKIADSSQRSNISALYAQQGYAPYYTLDETTGNFTLPQGEIYGMMLNQSTPHIIKTYINGTSGYIVWSNGWCIQRGLTDMSSVTIGATKTVSLLKEMSAIYDSDNPYQVLNSIYTNGIHTNDDCPSFIKNQTSTSFDFLRAGGQSASEFWEVSGYLKAGEY